MRLWVLLLAFPLLACTRMVSVEVSPGVFADRKVETFSAREVVLSSEFIERQELSTSCSKLVGKTFLVGIRRYKADIFKVTYRIKYNLVPEGHALSPVFVQNRSFTVDYGFCI